MDTFNKEFESLLYNELCAHCMYEKQCHDACTQCDSMMCIIDFVKEAVTDLKNKI